VLVFPLHLVDLLLRLFIVPALLCELRLLLINLTLLVFASILSCMKISGRTVNEYPKPIILVFLRLNAL
jgi:hypothetical protein